MPLDAAQLSSLLDASEPELVALGRTLATEQAVAFTVLAKFLDEHRGEPRALEVAAGIVRGVASVATLQPHREIYRNLLAADMEPQTISPQAIKVLALSLAMPSCDYWVKLHGRRIMRRVYELRRERQLSPDVLEALVSSGVAWELTAVETLDEAWSIMLAMCSTDEVDIVPAGRCVNVWEELAARTVFAGDAAIAGFIREHPRVFETEVLERIDELAALQSTDRSYSVLSQLFNTGLGMGARRWSATHAAWDATLGLQLFTQAQTRGLFDGGTRHNSFHVARGWLARDPSGYEALPREMVDAFQGLITGTPLPDILPPELDQQSPEQIEAALASYSGITVAQLYERLLPGQLCSGGFIKPGEHLGALIANDAATLRSLGLSRHELADRLAELMAQAPPDMQWHDVPPFQICGAAAMGHQHDPFHIYDVYVLHGHLGSMDFDIRRGDLRLYFGNLQLALIRRACFFGGPGCYRIDPAAAVELLQLR